jgi:hypothetical protein
MEKEFRSPKKSPVLRMLIRILEHCKSFEDFEELWQIQLKLLTVDESRIWYIWTFAKLKWSSPRDYKAYVKK